MRMCGACGQVLDPDAILCVNCGSSEIITATHTDPSSDETIAAYDRNWPAAKRHALSRKYFGDPDKEAYPVEKQEDLDNAAKLLHHADNPAKVKRRLRNIGRVLKLTIPPSLQKDSVGSMRLFACDKCGSSFEEDCNEDSCQCQNCLEDSAVLKPSTSLDGEGDDQEDTYICSSDEYQLLSDSNLEKGVLLRVRHVATIADAINGNKRLYPRAAIQHAVNGLRQKIRSGYRPYTEYRHPEAVRVGNDEHYVSHEDRKTGRIDDVEDPMPDGRVYITRSILDTPFGRKVAQAYKDKTHKGVSNRWKMRGYYRQLHGDSIHIAHDDGLDWHTTDDVDNPAFPETRNGYLLLTDEMRVELQLPAATAVQPAQSTADSASAKPANTTKKRTYTMNESFKKAKDAFYGLIGDAVASGKLTKTAVKSLAEARQAMADEMRLAQRAGEPTEDMVTAILKADEAAKMAGVSISGQEGGRPGPTGWFANQTGTPRNPGFAPDMEASSVPPDYSPGAKDPDDDSGAGGTPRGDGKKGKKGKGKDVVAQIAAGKTPDNTPMSDEEKKAKKDAKKKAKLDNLLSSLNLSTDTVQYIRDKADTEKKAKADEERKSKIVAALDEISTGDESIFKGLSDEMTKMIKDFTMAVATSPDDVKKIALAQKDSLMKVAAQSRLSGGGYDPSTSLRGQTTKDPGAPGFANGGNPNMKLALGGGTEVTDRGPSYMAKVDAILEEHDKFGRMLNASSYPNPNDRVVKSRRKYNRENFINPLISAIDSSRRIAKDGNQWAAMFDSACSDEDQALSDAISKAASDATGTSLSNVFNQPVILTALIIEQFQDMQSLQFVQGIGPGLAAGPRDPGWTWAGQFPDGRMGATIRVPVETYSLPGASGPGLSSTPANYGSLYGNQTDFGLLYPEGHGIDPGTPNVVWLEFFSSFRRIAADLTQDVIIQMGSGPLNYAAVARALFHITWDKSRRVDTANLNEMLLASDEYASVSVTNESPNLTYNSVYGASGNLTVNLNPTKAANATPSATDPSVTYGSNVIGIIRVQSQAGTSVSASSAVYAGTVHGTSPILRPRKNLSLSAIGQIVSTYLHPVTVSAPFTSNYTALSNSLEGFINPADGNIYNTPYQNDNAITALFAVDYENGLILLKTGSGISGSSNAITTTVTYSYYYATNFTNFVVNNVQALGLLQTGQSFQNYLNNMFLVFDQQAALMGSAPRFVKPDMAFMSLNASPNITAAEIFYKLQSPDGTNLFPTEDFFFERTGIMGARINAYWWGADRRIWLGRGGSTKYAINTPFEISGPYPKYEATTNKIVPGQIFYGEELSAQFTPMSVTQDGTTVINPVSSTIILR